MLRVRFRKKARRCYYWWKLSKECTNCSVVFLTTACKSVIIQNLKGGKEGRERGRKEGNQQTGQGLCVSLSTLILGVMETVKKTFF